MSVYEFNYVERMERERERERAGDRLPEPSGILAGFRQLEVRPKTQSWAKLNADDEELHIITNKGKGPMHKTRRRETAK